MRVIDFENNFMDTDTAFEMVIAACREHIKRLKDWSDESDMASLRSMLQTEVIELRLATKVVEDFYTNNIAE